MPAAPRAKWRDDLYVIIFEADTRAGQLFDIVLLIAIMLSIVVISLETVSPTMDPWKPQLEAVEWGLTLLFTAEYIARLLCVPKPLKYVFSFFGIVDLLACLPLYLTLFSGLDSKSLVIVRSIRLLSRIPRVKNDAHAETGPCAQVGSVAEPRKDHGIFGIRTGSGDD